MGVMACDRTGCGNILCDCRISFPDHREEYYACPSCLSELEEFKATWEPPMSEADILEKIREFMQMRPRESQAALDRKDIDVVFNRLVYGNRLEAGP